MSGISVRELAEDLKLSKQAVHNRIKQLPPNLMPKKVDGAYRLTPETVEEIRSMIGYSSTDSKVDNQQVDGPSIDVESLKGRIEDLKFNNNKLYIQIDKKDFQIETLQKLLDQQQRLTLQVNKQNEQLLLELDSYKDNETSKNDNDNFEEFEENKENNQEDIKKTTSNKWWKFWL